MTWRPVLAAAATCVALLGSPALAQEARFQLDLAWSISEIEPEQRTRWTNRTFTITLGKGGAIREEVTGDRGRRGSGRRARVREGALGEDLDARGRWRVVDEHTLLRVFAERSHTFAIRLRTDGARSCSVSLEWRLKPGFSAYEGWARRRDIPIRYRQPEVQQASCTVL